MEYTFGRNSKGVEILQTKGATNTDLSGRTEIKREYEDCYITDNCDVGTKYKSDKDDEGNCYDWYVITDLSFTVYGYKITFMVVFINRFNLAF